ncbi:MAG: hypothetical protein QXV12_01640 [Candidatus Rehaiarchaeum fermentans]|nr:hypothetical protein [Candidatus Rehaiarchaeum fermentans]
MNKKQSSYLVGLILILTILISLGVFTSYVSPSSIANAKTYSPYIDSYSLLASNASSYNFNINFTQIDNDLASIFPVPSGTNPLFFWLFVALVAVIVNAVLAFVPPLKEDKYKTSRMIVALIIAIFAAEVGISTKIIELTSVVFGLLVVTLLMILVISYMATGGSGKTSGASIIAIIVFILFVAAALIIGGIMGNVSVNHSLPHFVISPTLAFALGFIALLLIAGGGRTTKIFGIVLIIIAVVLSIV